LLLACSNTAEIDEKLKNLPLAFIESARGALFAQTPVIVIPVLLFN
jgi:hypothetical protein